MKNISLFILGLILYSCIYAAESDTIKADNPQIEYTGRIDFSNPLKPGFSYSGVSVRACFKGTSISVILNDAGTQNFYNIILDNGIISRLRTKSGLNTYSLANGLKDTIHEIEIFKITEETFGKTQFLGFLLDSGKTLAEVSSKREKLIEFIGNSITCGYGNEGLNGGQFGPTTENHYLTYAAITSRSFNARHLAVCKSGIGIYRNYDGPVDGNPDCMTNYYQRVYLYDALPVYSFAEKPDLICIDLGTNDMSTGKGDSARYVNKYLQFIDTIQLKNKSTDILCLLGPMLGGNDLSRVRKYLKFIVDSSNNKNNGKVYFFEMSQQTGSLGIGIDYHPTVAQHLKNAKELIGCIDTLTNWNVYPCAIFGTTKAGDEIVLDFNTGLQDPSGNFNGFSVEEDNIEVPVSGVYRELNDMSKVHLTLSKSLVPGKKIVVSYLPGSIEGINSIKLDGISSIIINNTLTTTKLTNAIIDANGNKVTLSFSKQMILPSGFDGILLFDSDNNVLTPDRFVLNSKNIEIFLKNKIKTGDTVFLSLMDGFFSTDRVAVSPVDNYKITNNSIILSVMNYQPQEFIIYPNPAINKLFNYRIDENVEGNFIADVYDLRGRLITSRILRTGTGEIDFKNNINLNGMYIIKIKTSEKEFSKVVIL